MFLKSLTISIKNRNIRKITFHKGINLVVDETAAADDRATGNNVGKTTVLKLIDFCLGADPKMIYVDPETKRDIYTLVKDYLVDNEVVIELVLKKDLDNKESREIVIKRNFLLYSKKLQMINNEKLTNDEFEVNLSNLIFPEHHADKPTFRQIISHNIRHKDESINQTLKTLDKYTSDAEYETLYLFLFGCEFTKGSFRQEVLEKINQEINFKKRLEKEQTKTAYEAALALVNHEIKELNEKKSNFNLNKNFEADLDNLNSTRYEINRLSSEISQLAIRRDLIIEAKKELSDKKANIDLEQLKLIYQQTTSNMNGIQHKFDDLVRYHNQMIVEKVKFITKELPELHKTIKQKRSSLRERLEDEKILASVIAKSDSFEELEELIAKIGEEHRKKGEFENTISQLNVVDSNVEEYNRQLSEVDNELFSSDFENTVKRQIDKFNKHFSAISVELYGEKYAVSYDIVTNRKNQRLYKFKAFNTNFSSGKKQGEISCFDLAYILFANEENIPCLHFLLNDKKELVHDNQLAKIAKFVDEKNIQFVASILKDKLPDELNDEKYFVVKLSQQDKLFRIEKNKS